MKDLRGVLWVVSHSMLKILSGVILLLLMMNTFFVSPVESVGSTVYVDGVSGNDSSGNGDLATPFRTVQKALQVACCGIKIIILAGDYPESITMNKQVTIEAQGGLVRIGTVPDTGFEITSLPATDTDGNYTLEWTCSGLCPSNYNIQEDSDTNFNNPTIYFYTETNAGQPQSYDFTNKPNGTYCYRIVGSGSKTSAPACVDVLIQKTPSLTGTVNSDGTITLDWTYDWFCGGFASSQDGYELEESTAPNTGFVKVYWTAFTSSGDRESPKSYTTSSKSPGTYYYRVRAYDYSCGGYTSYSNIVQVEVTTPTVTNITYYATFDNLMINSSEDPVAQTTVYQSDDLAVGNQWTYNSYLNTLSYVWFQSAIWFDIYQDISGKTINNAVFRLYPYVIPNDFETEYALNAIYGEWDSNYLTWDNKPLIYLANEVRVTPPVTTALPMEFDVTAIVQNWADGSWENNGFILHDTKWVFPVNEYGDYYTAWRSTGIESMEYWFGYERRPQLYIEYQ